MAQNEHPEQWSLPLEQATRTPRWSTLSASVIFPVGHAEMHNPQPLQRLGSMVMVPFDTPCFIKTAPEAFHLRKRSCPSESLPH
jgi:hypothetical protein